jgi:hypothetical protein
MKNPHQKLNNFLSEKGAFALVVAHLHALDHVKVLLP